MTIERGRRFPVHGFIFSSPSVLPPPAHRPWSTAGAPTSWGAALSQPPGQELPGGQRAGMGLESCEFPWLPISAHTCECSQLPPVYFPAIAPGSTG